MSGTAGGELGWCVNESTAPPTGTRRQTLKPHQLQRRRWTRRRLSAPGYSSMYDATLGKIRVNSIGAWDVVRSASEERDKCIQVDAIVNKRYGAITE